MPRVQFWFSRIIHYSFISFTSLVFLYSIALLYLRVVLINSSIYICVFIILETFFPRCNLGTFFKISFCLSIQTLFVSDLCLHAYIALREGQGSVGYSALIVQGPSTKRH